MSDLTAKLEAAKADIERLSHQPKVAPTEPPNSSRPSTRALVMLLPGLRSVGGGNRVTITPNTRDVQLVLSVTEYDYSGYRVNVKTEADTVVWSKDNIRSTRRGSGKIVELLVPATRLKNGVYFVGVYGMKDNATPVPLPDYSFEVQHKPQ